MKLDVTKIEGYEEMTPEEKVKALEAYETPEPDYSGYVKKDMFDKTASELAGAKKQLKERLSEDEQAKAKEAEERAELQAKYEELLHKTAVSENIAKLVALGYDDKLASSSAEAMVNGDLNTVIANQHKHLEAVEKKIRAEVLNQTPRPTGEGEGTATMTLDTFRKLSPAERAKFSTEHPEEYREIYGGTE